MEVILTRKPEPPFAQQIVKLLLPKEHGSWSLAMEPLALGLLVATSAAGVALAVAALAGFFLRRPLKLALFGKSDPRRSLASGWSIILAASAVAGLLLAAKLAGVERLWPLIPAAAAGIAFAWFDSRNEARAEAAELAGTIAFGILPAAFAALAGWSVIESIALALVMLARSLPTVMFVRTYMRLKKGRAVTRIPALIAAGSGLFLTTWLALAHIAPWAAVLFIFLLAVLTFCLLGNNCPQLAAKTIGLIEMTLGVAMVLALALAWK